MIKYLIVDDEPIAHDIIKRYCDLLPHLQLTKQCYDALEALDYLRTNTVDLIFLDLNMPKLKGFDFLKTLPHKPKIIVTTAYQEYAIEGYELEIVDYLLKPFSFERFLKAVTKITTNNSHKNSQENNSYALSEEQIFLHTNKTYLQVNTKDILFIEAEGNYAKFVFETQNILVREKLSDALKKLSPINFIQVHKSFVVSKNKIEKIEGNRISIGKHLIPIGKQYKTNVLSLLE